MLLTNSLRTRAFNYPSEFNSTKKGESPGESLDPGSQKDGTRMIPEILKIHKDRGVRSRANDYSAGE